MISRHSERDAVLPRRWKRSIRRRAAEAVTVRARATELLDGEGEDRALVVLGDLNDEVETATSQIPARPAGLGDRHAGR